MFYLNDSGNESKKNVADENTGTSRRDDLARWTGYWFSASQVGTFDDCPRKWALQKIDGLRAPPGPSLALGLELHDQTEHWLKEGRPINTLVPSGPIVMAGLHLLPMPKSPGLRVEQEFTIEIGGHQFRGFKDYEVHWPGYLPKVGDHKSTKDFRWAKTAEFDPPPEGEEDNRLRVDPQACLYAAETMWRTGSEACELEWMYYRTTGAPKVEPVRVIVTRTDVEPVLQRMVESCNTMTALLDMAATHGLRAMDIPPNAKACDKFGGCEFQNLCNLSPAQRMTSIMTQQIHSHDLLSKLQSMNGINPPPNGQPQMPPGYAGPPPMPPGQMALPMASGASAAGQFTPPMPPMAISPGGQVMLPMAPQGGPPGPPPQPIQVNGQWVLPPQGSPMATPPGPPPQPIQVNGQWVLPPQGPPAIPLPPQQAPVQQAPVQATPPAVPLPPTGPKTRRSKKQREADEAAAAAAQAGTSPTPPLPSLAPEAPPASKISVAAGLLVLSAEAGAALEQATQILRAIANSVGMPDAKFIFTLAADGSVKRSVQITRGL